MRSCVVLNLFAGDSVIGVRHLPITISGAQELCSNKKTNKIKRVESENPSGSRMRQCYVFLVLCTHSLWVLRLLKEGRELQHSELGASNTSTLPRGGTGRHGQPCCAFITCRWKKQWVLNVWFGCDKVQLENAAILQLFPWALCKLSIMSRVVSSLCRHDSLLSTQQGGKRAPTCYGGRAGRLHGVTLLGEGLNAGEMRQTREREECYAPSQSHDPISRTNWTTWPL